MKKELKLLNSQCFRICLLLLATIVVLCSSISAASCYVGESIYFDNPTVNGRISSAAWYCNRNDDVTITKTSSGASVRIDQYFSGTATVTCQYAYISGSGKYNGKETYTISCKKSKVTLDKTELTIPYGSKDKLTISNSSGKELPYASWRTSDKNVANFNGSESVNSYGKTFVEINGAGPGECVVTFNANTGEVNPTCKVKVIANKPSSIKISNKNVSLLVGKEYLLGYTLLPSGSYSKVFWSSSDNSVVTVDTRGWITGKKAGKATITVKTENGKSDKIEVMVKGIAEEIKVKKEYTFYVGYVYEITPEFLPVNTSDTYSITSSNTDILSIRFSGLLIASKIGDAKLTYKTAHNKTATTTIHVVSPPRGFEIDNIGPKANKLSKLTYQVIHNHYQDK